MRESSLARFGNAIHTTTRRRVIERELLFAPGERFDSAKVAETARNLRALGIFRRVLIDSIHTDSGTVLRVTTKDGWSTRPQVDFSSTGGQTVLGARTPGAEPVRQCRLRRHQLRRHAGSHGADAFLLPAPTHRQPCLRVGRLSAPVRWPSRSAAGWDSRSSATPRAAHSPWAPSTSTATCSASSTGIRWRARSCGGDTIWCGPTARSP